MRRPTRRPRRLPNREQRATTAAWIASVQRRDGEIPWFPGGKMDPWDHVHAAMGLAASGMTDAARAAYRYLAATQEADGGWACERRDGAVANASHESNHAAYLATGLWHLHRSKPAPDFLAEMWPVLERAIEFVVGMQEPSGAISWAVDPAGRVWRAPLLTGSSSIHGSLVCAVRIAERLDHDRPAWRRARERLAHVLRREMDVFTAAALPEPPGRHSMDWYYPVLGGALRGREGRARLLDEHEEAAFIEEGVGCRCVRDRPWYTIAETCELVLALDGAGLRARAKQIFSWAQSLRTESGGYWTGATHPEGEIYPAGEQTAWTAATVLLAADAIADDSPTSAFFRELAGEDLEPAVERPAAPPAVVDPLAASGSRAFVVEAADLPETTGAVEGAG